MTIRFIFSFQFWAIGQRQQRKKRLNLSLYLSMCSSFTFSKGLHSIIPSVLQLHVIDTHAIPYVCLVLFKLYFVATLDIYMIIKLVCCLKAIWQWFALSHRHETLTGLFFSLGTYGVCGCAFVFWWQRVTVDSHSSTLCLCVSGSGWLEEYSVCARMHTPGCVDEIVLCFVPPHLSPEERLWWSSCCVCVCVIVCVHPRRRNASSWAEPSDGGGASADHPRQFNWPQYGGW